MGIQPADVYISHDLVRIDEIQEHNIVYALLDVVDPSARHGEGYGIVQPILDDTHVMGCEIPKGVNVTSDPAKIEPLTVDITDLPKLATIDQTLHVAHRRVEQERVPRHYGEPLGPRCFAETLYLLKTRGQRFLY
jgi:hypothetical protein